MNFFFQIFHLKKPLIFCEILLFGIKQFVLDLDFFGFKSHFVVPLLPFYFVFSRDFMLMYNKCNDE